MSRGETARLAAQVGIALTAGMISIVPVAQGAPVLDKVVSGGATVNVATDTTITSTTKNNVINWTDFSVGENETVTFDNGNRTNNYLNIVTGDDTSAINGAVRGGDNVYIVNPNGVIFGKNSAVDVGNLYVSTRPISELATTAVDASGNIAPFTSTTPQALGGDIVNLGTIQADTVKVEGVNITFLSTADVTTDGSTANTSVAMTAANRIDIGDNDNVAPSYTTSAASVNTHQGTGVYDQATLAAINNNLSGDYWLAQDITTTGTYTPIGGSTAFTGTFDGAFHTVSGISVASGEYGGLFGHISGATVENVGVDAGSVKAKYAGGVVGLAENNSTLKNVFNNGVTVETTATGRLKNRQAGGIVANATATTIDTAYNKGAILSNLGAGIVGIVGSNSTITNTYNDQRGNSNNRSEYGIIGDTAQGATNSSIKISNSYTTTSAVAPSSATVSGKDAILTNTTGTVLSYYSGLTGVGNTADTATTWRIYEGQSLPLLAAFLNAKGTYTVKYNYTQGSSVSGSNDGKDLQLTYNNNAVAFSDATYWSNGIQVLNVDGVTQSANTYKDVMYDASTWSEDGSNVTINKSSAYYTGQSGYNLIGANITINQREVDVANILNNNPTITKVYDGTTAISTDAVKTLFDGAESSSSGIISGDTTVTLDTSSVSGTFDSADVGAGKNVTLSGGIGLKNAQNYANYKLSATSTTLDGKTIGGTITQKDLKVTLANTASIDKVYDGTAAVTTAPSVDIFTLDEGVTVDGTTEDVKLGLTNSAAGTYVDKDGTTYTVNANAGSHSVAYSGLTLTGNNATNYRLVDEDGNVLYSVAVNGVGEDVNATTGGTLYAAGTINRRLISSTDFMVQDASGKTATGTKVYDGTSDFTLDTGMSIVNTGTASGDTGIVTSDADKLHFTLSTGTTSYFVQEDGTTKTKNVADAKKIAYQVEAGTETGYEYLLNNYKIGTSDTDATNLEADKTYSVLGDGAITRRELTIALARDTGLDKTYDTTKELASEYTTSSAISYGTSSARLLGDDTTTTTTDDAAWSISGVYDSANVARDSNGNVTAQDVTYTIGLTGNDAANYTLNGQNAENTTLTLKATGTINPKDVTAKANSITKTYDGTTGVGKDTDTTGLGFTIDGAYDSDSSSIAIDYSTDNIYYADKNAGQAKTVNYSGLSLSGTAAGNYNLTNASITGTGTINKRAITKDDVTATFGKIEKTYDNTTAADATKLQSLTVNNVTGDDLVFAVSKAYYNDKNRLGDADLQAGGVTYELTLTDADQLNNYTLGDGLTGNALTLTTDGYIYQKALTVAAVDTNPTKQYDATTDVIGSDGSVLTGDGLVTVTGLIAADGTTNATTAAYDDKNAGSRTVTYKLELANEPTGSSNYKFVDADGNTITTIETAGTINKRELYAKFADVTKVYDTDATVASDKISATLTDANGNTDSIAAKEGVTLTIGDSGVTGTYGLKTGDDFAADENVGTKTVRYTNLIAALGSNADNYTIADTTYGVGTITPASITADSFKFTFDTITKTYDGTTAIAAADAASAVLNHYVDLGLAANPEFTYTIDSAAYTDKNAGTSKGVTYTITIDLSTLTNYEVKGVTGKELTQSYTQNNGVINRREVYATIKNDVFAKTYDATTAVKDASGNVLTGDSIITLDGLTGNDGATNISSAAYTDKNVGDAKVINYTVALDANSAGNYVIYKASDRDAANKTELTSAWASAAVNTITPYSLKLEFSKAEKDYDGTTDVYTANGSATPTLAAALNGDVVSLAANYTAAYDDPNVKGLNGDGKHTVTYDKLALTGADAGNYILADANGTVLTTNTDGTYRTTGDGVINKFKLTEAPKFTIDTVTKEYDGTDKVAYTGTGKDGKTYYRDSSADALQNYILSDATVTVNGKTMPVYFTISDAKYTAGADVGTNKDVSFVVKLSGDNYDFSGLNGIAADGSFSGAATATTGDITKRHIYISTDDTITIEKTYDGDNLVDNDVTNKIIVREGDILDADKDRVNLDRTKLNATYDDKDAGKGKTVSYNVVLTGDAASNYEIHNLANLSATSDDAITTITSSDGIINKATLEAYFGAIDRTYEKGNTAITLTGDKITLTGVANEKVTLNDAALALIKGNYGKGGSEENFTADENVSWDGETVTDKDVLYTGIADALAKQIDSGDSIAKNYTIADTAYFAAAQAKGKIKPIAITQGATVNWTAATKTYDATTDVIDPEKYLSIGYTDTNGDTIDIGYELAAAAYDSKNVGDKRTLNYTLKSVDKKLTADGTNYNYVLDDSYADTLVAKTWTSGANNTINKLTINAALTTDTGLDKVYDGTTDASEYLANLVIDKSALAVLSKDNIGAVVTAEYDNANAGDRKVTYTLGLDTASENYELVSTTYEATGTIARRGLTITATPEKVRVGDALPEFTGTVTGYVASDKALIDDFQNRLLNFRVDDDTTTTKPGKYAVYGWYANAAGDLVTSGDFGQNYTLVQDAANVTAFTVELVDPGREYHENVNPKTQFIPDQTSYNQAAMDYSGAYRGNGAAALEYHDSHGTVLGEIAITGIAPGTNNITGSHTVTGPVDTDGTVMAPGVGASYGIAGGNVVNIEGAAVATTASIDVEDGGEVINLEVRPLTASEIAIENTDSTGAIA